jgi:hypothetical protein
MDVRCIVASCCCCYLFSRSYRRGSKIHEIVLYTVSSNACSVVDFCTFVPCVSYSRKVNTNGVALRHSVFVEMDEIWVSGCRRQSVNHVKSRQISKTKSSESEEFSQPPANRTTVFVTKITQIFHGCYVHFKT